MSTITKQWLQQKIADMEATRDEIPFGLDEDDSNTLAALRIALASLEAEPAIHRWRRVPSEPYGPYPWHYGDFIGFSKPVDGIEDEYFYSAPPAPAPVSDEDKVLAEQARAVVHCLDMCGVPSGDYADNEQLQLWGRVIEYGRHPASVSVPDRSMFEKWWESEHGSPLDSWDSLRTTDGYCDDGIDGQFEAWNACRSAMLQGADGI